MADQYYTTYERANAYDSTAPVFDALFLEIKELCKKKPDATINSSKIKLINRILSDVKSFLSDMTVMKYLDLLDEEIVPQYSDVVLIMSQYSAGLEQFKKRHYGFFLGDYQWIIKEKENKK